MSPCKPLCRIALTLTLCALLAAWPGAAHALSGGPDGGGYVFSDSTETVSPPVWSWDDDISATGTALNLPDDGARNVPIGFTFHYYGRGFTNAVVSSNGHIDFAEGFGNASLNFSGIGIPAPSNLDPLAGNGWGVNPLVAPWFDDFSPPDHGQVYYQTKGSLGSRRFIVQWNQVMHYDCKTTPPADYVTFQAVFYEGSHLIEFKYLDAETSCPGVSKGFEGTVGIALDEYTGLEYSLNTAALSNTLLVRFKPQGAATLSVEPSASVDFGDTLTGSTASRVVRLANTGLSMFDVVSMNTVDPLGAPFAFGTDNCTGQLVAPGGSCAFTLMYSPTAAGASAESFDVQTTAGSATVSLIGNGVGAYTGPRMELEEDYSGFASDLQVEFGTMELTNSVSHTLSVSNVGATSLVLGTVGLFDSTGMFSATSNCDGLSIAAGGFAQCTITLTFAPTALGPQEAILNVPSNDPAANPASIFLSGTGASAFEPDIAVIDTDAVQTDQIFSYGDVGTGTFVDAAFTVRNVGTDVLNISTVAVTDGLILPFSLTSENCVGTSLLPNQECTVTVRFFPTALAPYTDSFEVASDDPDEPSVTVAISGVGSAPPAPEITVIDEVIPLDTTLPFGGITVGTSATKVVTVRNDGTLDLTISGITNVAAPFSRVTTCAATLAAGASCTVSVTFAPTSTGTFNTSFSITSNDSDEGTVPVYLSGTGNPTGAPEITVTDAVAPADDLIMGFGDVVVGSSSTKNITVKNDGTLAMNIWSVSVTGTDFTKTTTCGATLAAGASCTVSVTFAPAATGFALESVSIASDDSNENPVTVFVSATGIPAPAPDILVTDDIAPTNDLFLPFGQVTLLSSSDQTVRVTNNGTATLTVAVSSLILPFSIVTNGCNTGSVASGGSCTVVVRYRPTAAGSHTGTLTITSNDADTPSAAIALSGSGLSAGAPEIQVTDSVTPADDLSVDFGTLVTGSSASKTVTVKNIGTSDLSITGVQMPAAPFTIVNTCPASLSAGGSCTITVTYSPTMATTSISTVQISSSDTSENPVSVVLLGSATAAPVPDISVTDSSAPSTDHAIAYGTVTQGQTATQTITVTNVGSVALTVSGVSAPAAPFSISADGCSTQTLAAGAFCVVTVAYAPTAVGQHSSSIAVTSNDPDSPSVSVALAGSGTTLFLPDVVVTDDSGATTDHSIAFPMLTLPGTATASIYVRNGGTAEMTFTRTSPIAPFSIPADSCTSPIPVGASCTITVGYAPSASGTQTGSVTISTNDPDTPAVTVSLTGSAVPAGMPEITVLDEVAPTDDLSLDFGPVTLGTSLTRTITIRNDGTAALATTAISTPGTAFTPSHACAYASITPGATCTITMTFTPPSAGEFSSSISIGSNDATEDPVRVYLSGTGSQPPTPDIAVTDSVAPATDLALIFGTLTTGQTASQSITVTNVGTALLTITGIIAPNSPFSISSNGCSSGAVDASSSCVMTVQFAPNVAGTFPGRLTVISNDPDEATVTYILTGSATALPVPDIGLTDSSGAATDHAIAFSQLETGQTSTATVTVTNYGTATLTISAFTNPGSPFSVPTNLCGATVAPNASCQITLQYSPTAAGTFDDFFVISSDDPDSGTASVSLTGTAILPGAPDITVTDAVAPATDLTMPFGDVTVGGSASLVITATNNGTRDLAVSGVTPPASPFSITANSCTGATLAPTASCTLTVTFAPTGAGVNTSSLQIQSNDPDESGVTVYLSGTALAVLVPNIAATDSVAPATDLSVPYGTLTVGQSATQHVTLTNTGNTTLTLTGVTPPASPFSITANSCGGTLAEGAACVISVTYSPMAPSVLDTATLTVASDDPDTATLTVNLGAAATAAPVPDVAVTDSIAPTSDNLLPFGSVTVGSSVAQTVLVTNRGTAALTITSITGPVATFGITANSCPASLAAGSSCMVTVQYAPAALGAHTGTVTVNTNDPDTATVAVALTGTGVAALAPEITVTDAVAPTDDLVMEFGSVTLGTSSSLAITVKNDGTSALTLTGVSLPAAPFSLSNSCPSSLAAGASCTLTVALAPTATGTVTSSVSIGSNDSNENPVKVLLSGVGLAAPAPNITATDSAAPASDLTVPFGTVTSGQSGTHSVTLTNSGTAPLNITSISTLVAPFARTTDCGLTLAAGASCLVTVTYAPTSAPATYTDTLSIATNDADTPGLNITLSGTSVAAPVADASFTDSVAPATDSLVAFDTLTTGTSTTESITVANLGTASMTVAYSTLFAPFAVSGCAAGSVAAGSSCTLTVQYAPTVAGTHSGSITVDTNDPDSPSVSFSVTGSAIVPPVPQISVTDEVAPTTDHFVPFGDVTVSTTSTRTITVHNTGTALLTISDISSPAAPFSATNSCGATLAPGASCSLSVTFAPTASGFDFKALSIDSDAANAATVTVQLTGTGVAAPVPNIAVADSVVPSGDKAILYGTVTVGQTSTQSVTASNTGTATLNISGITAPAAPFSVITDSCTGAALAPGTDCTVSVMYAPTSAAAHTGTLAINSDDPDSASVAVDLSGTSQAAAVADIAVADSSGSSSDLAVSYGTLTVNASATHTVTLTNNGTALLTLVYTSPSAPFLSGTTCGASLAAAGSCTFTVTYTPTVASTMDTGALTITTNDPDTPTVTVSFTGKAEITLVPMITVTDGTVPADDSTMAYGDVTVGTAVTNTITVTNSGTALLTIKGVTSPVAPFLLSSGCGASLAPGASCTLTVTFAPTVAGLTLTNVAISTDAQNRPEAAVSVFGMGVDAPEPNVALTDSVIPANDSDMDYGTLTVGSASEESVIVSNTGTAALTVAITTAPATPFGITSNSCAGGSVPVGAACVIRITYAPTAVGSHAGSITLATNDPDTPTLTVALTGSAQLTLVQDITVTDGVGLPSDGVMDFGAVTVGQTSQANITVASTGTAPLAMGGVTHSSTHFTLTNGCASSVPAGTSCTIGVSYAPTATGTHNDTVLISSGDPDTSLVAINLSGQGTILPTPNVEVSDSIGASTDLAMDFGSVAVGTQSTPASVIVSNTGTGSTKLSIQQPSSPFQMVSGTNTCASGILAAGASCTFSVNYSPTASGTHLSTVTVGSESPTITVQLSGTAYVPAIANAVVTDEIGDPDDLTLDFGNVAVNGSITNTITVTNNGTAPLSVTLPVANAPFTVRNNQCSTVVTGASCTFQVEFAPTAAGSIADSLNLASNDPDSPAFIVLKGTGDTTAPTAPVLVSPSDGKTGLGTSVTFTWKKSVAVAGDTVKYDLYYSTDASFAGATTVTITNTTTTASTAPADARSWAAAALILGFPVFGLAAGMSRRRMALAMLVIVIALALGLVGCGNGIDAGKTTTTPVVSQNISTTVTGLQKGTVYYWKVKATGNNGASESEAWTFVTAL